MVLGQKNKNKISSREEIPRGIIILYNDMTSYIETKITPSSGTSYFTARDGFNSIKHNGVLIIQSYINITTQIPANTVFANTGLSNSDVIHGTLGFLKTDGSKVYPLTIASQARLSTNDSAVPTGYYYIIGAIIYKS